MYKRTRIISCNRGGSPTISQNLQLSMAKVLLAFLLKENVPVEEAEQRAEEAEQRADIAESMAETGIQLFIENSQEFAASKEATFQKLVERFGLSQEEAENKIQKYWKAE